VGKDQELSSLEKKITYNLIGKPSSEDTTPIVSETKLCEWPMGVRRRMAQSTKIAAITPTDTNVMIFLFIFLWLLFVCDLSFRPNVHHQRCEPAAMGARTMTDVNGWLASAAWCG